MTQFFLVRNHCWPGPKLCLDNSLPSKGEKKRKGPKSISRSYRPQSTTNNTSKSIGIAIVICLLIWLILGISTGLIGQLWYWIFPLIGIISGISKGSGTRPDIRPRMLSPQQKNTQKSILKREGYLHLNL
jgi:hypothetical protein